MNRFILLFEDTEQAIGRLALNPSEIAGVQSAMGIPVIGGEEPAIALRRIDPHVKMMAASRQEPRASRTLRGTTGIAHFVAKPYAADTMLTILQRASASEAAVSAPQNHRGGSLS